MPKDLVNELASWAQGQGIQVEQGDPEDSEDWDDAIEELDSPWLGNPAPLASCKLLVLRPGWAV